MSDFGVDQWWEVVAPRGCLVRQGLEASTAEVGTLEHGKRIRVAEAGLSAAGGDRLRICEPVLGWVSRSCVHAVDHRDTNQPNKRWAIEAKASGRARWAVNIHNCELLTEEGDESKEWRFLFLPTRRPWLLVAWDSSVRLGLIKEKHEREAVGWRVLSLGHFPPQNHRVRRQDKIRALISRLLIRCCEVTLEIPHEDVAIERTKGKKPFLTAASRAKGLELANKPNFNFNVSHEGTYVVLASEPCCVCGCDVAAPEQFRRKPSSANLTRTASDPTAFFRTMRDTLTLEEWAFVKATKDPESQAERFRYFWSCKEAFTKARGDGIAFGIDRAQFDLQMIEGPRVRFQANVAVDGDKLPQWRFFGEELAEGHIVTVARGPPKDIVDAVGSFRKSFSRERLDDSEFDAPHPNFVLLTLRDLVPNSRIPDYDAAVAAGFSSLRREEEQ